MSCPTDQQIRQYIQGDPLPPDAEAMAAHFVTCAACRAKRDEALRDLGTQLSGVEMTAAPPPLEISTVGPALDGPLAQGTAVGRYTILARVGSGGMGVVYSAYDPKLDRKVALKFFTTDKRRRHPSLQTRFLREAQAMAHLSHPNVVAVHDVGTIGEDVFIAMEFVDGRDLRGWLKETPRSWREVVDVMAAAGRGLAAAHRVGLIHRDIKPSNILVGHDGRARVMDFGLARNVEGREESDPDLKVERDSALDHTLTQKGAVMGTPQYMAPEQRLGGAVDARADQFAFSATLYRALYDQIPFGKIEQHEMSLGKAVRPLEPPASRKVPERIKKVVYRGLSMLPQARFPSMDALLDLLTARPFRLSRRSIGVGAAVALAAVGLVAYPLLRYQRAQVCAGADEQLGGVWDATRRSAGAAAFLATHKPYAEAAWQRAQSALDAYAAAWSAARTSACEATLVRHEASPGTLARRDACLDRRLRDLGILSSLFAKADAQVVDGAAGTIEGLSPVAACMSAERTPPTGVTRAVAAEPESLQTTLAQADVLFEAARFDEVRKLVDQSLPEAKRRADPVAIAHAVRLEGQLAFEEGRYDEARDELQDAEWTAEGAADSESSARIATELVTLAYRQSQFDLAHLWANHARALIRAAGGDEGLESDLDVREAVVYRAEAKMARAEDLGQRAYALRLQRFGPNSARVANALMQLSNVSASQGEDARALEYVSQAAEIFERAAGPGHPDTSTARGLQGAYLVRLGRCSEATALLEGALKTREAANPSHPYLGLNHWDLANLYRKLGDAPRAQAHFEMARALVAKGFGPDHRYAGSLMADLGRLLVQQGRPNEALPLQDQALAILSKSPTRDFGGACEPQTVRGLALGAQGAWAKARDAYAEALAAGQRLLGPKDPRLSEPLTGQAEAALALGRPADALPLLRAAVELRRNHPGDPADEGRTQFAMARALWETGARSEAGEAVDQSRALMLHACSPALAGLPQLEAWRKDHPP